MISIPEYLHGEHSILLNDQQKVAVETDASHILLLAVPGSGKTTVLVSRIAHLIVNCSRKPERMLILTFSRESAKDMKRRFEALFSNLIPNPPRFSTIHSFCYRVLREYAQRYRRTLPNIIGEQTGILLRRIYQEINGEYLSEDLLESLINDIGLVKNRMLSREGLEDYEISTDHFSEILEQYDRAKKENGFMDYDDMLVFAYDILQKVPALLIRLKESYDDIMVDEAQDTSRLQHAILRLVGDGANLFMVGDEDQCIYAFRGADPDELMQFDSRYPDAVILKIEENYRSGSDLVTAANRLIQLNQMRYEKKMISSAQLKSSVEAVQLGDYSEQSRLLLEMIRKENGSAAILYRNNESAVPVLDLFLSNRIEYDIKDYNLGFFNSFVVRDIVSYLRLSLHPKDLDAFEQIYYKCGCSKAVYSYVCDNISSYDSVFDAASDSPGFSYFLKKKLTEYQTALRIIGRKSPKDAIDLVETRMGYREYLDRKSGGGTNRVNCSLKLMILKNLASRRHTVEDFLFSLDDLQKKLSESPSRSAERKLTLSSIHSSKGLEFDTVYLLDFIDGILPSRQALDDLEYDQRDELEGEVRLFYVAVTRAKKKLIAFVADYCNDERAAPSRFFARYFNQDSVWNKREEKEENFPDLSRGAEVKHVFFGRGIVTGLEQDRLTIYFERYGTKELSRRFCIKNHLIRVLK